MKPDQHWLAFALVSLVSCTTPDPSAEGGVGSIGGDHVLSGVPALELGIAVSGHVGGGQIDAYSITLRNGDVIELEMTGGADLRPDVTLYSSLTTKIPSTSYQVGEQSILKRYAITSTGTYYAVARAYQRQGEGDFTLAVRCTGGPCAGETPPVEPLDAWQAGECIRRARECALLRMDAVGGEAVTPATVWNACLERVEVDGLACTNACGGDGPESAPDLCGYVANELLPFYAGRTPACRAELASCMSDCAAAAGDGPAASEDLSDSTEAVCLYNGFNGDCDAGYARQLVACGGSVEAGSVRACHLHCEATFGAWADDLDTICTEECGTDGE